MIYVDVGLVKFKLEQWLCHAFDILQPLIVRLVWVK